MAMDVAIGFITKLSNALYWYSTIVAIGFITKLSNALYWYSTIIHEE